MDGKSYKEIIIIGCGGIATGIIPGARRYFRGSRFVFVDGDTFEESNESRQEGKLFIEKAKYWKEETENSEAITKYITKDNAKEIIKEETLVFSCVDNHATRKLIQDRCSELKNVVLISGGNTYTKGDASIYIRSKRANVTPRIDFMQPDIQFPKDKHPDDVSCLEEIASKPQLIFTNNAVAAAMLNMIYNTDEPKYTMVYVDIETNKTISFDRRTISGWKNNK